MLQIIIQPVLLDVLGRHHLAAVFGQQGQQGGVGTVGGKAHSVIVDNLHFFDHFKNVIFSQRLISCRAFVSIFYIRCGKRVAVVPGHIVTQLELPSGIIDHLVTLGQHADPSVVFVGALHQTVTEVAQYGTGDTVVVVLHIEGGDVAALGDSQYFFVIVSRGGRAAGRVGSCS